MFIFLSNIKSCSKNSVGASFSLTRWCLFPVSAWIESLFIVSMFLSLIIPSENSFIQTKFLLWKGLSSFPSSGTEGWWVIPGRKICHFIKRSHVCPKPTAIITTYSRTSGPLVPTSSAVQVYICAFIHYILCILEKKFSGPTNLCLLVSTFSCTLNHITKTTKLYNYIQRYTTLSG